VRGHPLISHVFATLAEARRRGVVTTAHVVVAPEDSGVRTLADASGIAVIVNPEPDQGLSGSLRRGLAGLGPDPRAALVLLGDQPLVRAEVIEALVAAWRAGRGTVVRPRYAQSPSTPGHPVLLDRTVWPLAQRIEGDVGLASVLPAGAAAVVQLDVPGANPDIDTPADLLTLNGPSS